MVRVFVSNFVHQRPEHEIDQESVLKWLSKAHAKNGANCDKMQERLLSIGLGPEKAQKRGMFYQDCLHENWDEMDVYGKSMEERMGFFEDKADEAVRRFYADELFPEDVIHVSCTGYVAPSPVQKLMAQKSPQTVVTHAYHMGCYGALSGLRIGQGFLAAGKSSVDIVHTELCSLHMGTHRHSMDQLIAETLFADGLIKYSLSKNEKGFEIVKLYEELIPNTSKHMTWKLENWGMAMTLAIDIPLALGRAIKGFVQRLYKSDFSKVYFAIHPGGPKIIEQIARILKLERWQVQHSLDVFNAYGNMSSATVPHIWERMQKDLKPGSEVISLAFGPGLTIVGAHLRC